MKNKIKINFYIFFIFFLLSIFIYIPKSSHALTTGGIGAYPAHPDPNIKFSQSWFIYSLDLGESKEDAILLNNTTNEEQTVKLYPVDAIPSNQGNFALEAENALANGIGAWIQLSEKIITLRPGEQREIPFTIAIPINTDVGEHAGGIIIQKAKPGEVEGSGGASIVTRIGVRVYETVPGEIIRNIEISDFSVKKALNKDKAPYFDIGLTAINKSNVSILAKTDLEIRGWGKIQYFKKSKLEGGLTIDFKDFSDFFKGEILEKDWQLMRGQKVSTRWEWPYPEFGRYTFQVKMTYGEGAFAKQALSRPITVWVIPWLELGILFGILFAIIAFFAVKRLRYRPGNLVKYIVKSREQLIDIAEKNNMPWKRLVKINKLKTPFVRAGQVILVTSNAAIASAAGKKVSKIPKKRFLYFKYFKSKTAIVVFTAAVIIILLIVFISLRGSREEKPPANTGARTDAARTEISPKDISVGIYDPREEPMDETKLLEERLKELGFKTKISLSIIDGVAANDEATTILYKNKDELAIQAFVKETIKNSSFRKGYNEYIAEDIVIGSWNIDDVRWGSLSDKADSYINPKPENVSILAQNAGAKTGAAGKLANLLKENGYALARAENAPNIQEGTIVYYKRNYKKTAEKIAKIASQQYPNISFQYQEKQDAPIVIIIGVEK